MQELPHITKLFGPTHWEVISEISISPNQFKALDKEDIRELFFGFRTTIYLDFKAFWKELQTEAYEKSHKKQVPSISDTLNYKIGEDFDKQVTKVKDYCKTFELSLKDHFFRVLVATMGYDEKRFIELAVESQAINPKEELEKLVEQIKLVICSDFDKNAEEVKLRTFNFNVPGDQQKIAHLRFLTQAKQARILDGVKLSEIFYSLQNDVEKVTLN